MENGEWRMKKRGDRNRAGVFSGDKSATFSGDNPQRLAATNPQRLAATRRGAWSV